MNTPEEIKKLILQAKSFTPVKLTAQPGSNINVQLGYGSVRAIALTPINGNAIAFQTDQGNWYVIGESSGVEANQSDSRRQISYRVVRPKTVEKYPVKTIFAIETDSTIEFYLGGDRNSKKLINRPLSRFYGWLINLGKDRFYVYSGYPSYNEGNLIIDDKSILTVDFYEPITGVIEFFSYYLGGRLNTIRKISSNKNRNILEKDEIRNIQTIVSDPRIVLLNSDLYGWEYYNTEIFFNDEYERDITLTSFNNKVETNLTLTSSNDVTIEEITGIDSTATGILGDDNVWRTGFFYDELETTTGNIVTDKTSTYTVEGESTIIYTPDGYINQNYRATLSFTEGYELLTRAIDSRQYYALKDATHTPNEELNEVTLHYGNTSILLNTNDFGCFDMPLLYEFLFIDDTFTFTFNVLGTKQSTTQDFDPEILTGEYIANTTVLLNTGEYSECLLKGEITEYIFSYSTMSILGQPVEVPTYTVTCSITTFQTNVITSFNGRLIINNGSFYNFIFRKKRNFSIQATVNIPTALFNVFDTSLPSAYFQGVLMPYAYGWVSTTVTAYTKTTLPFLFFDSGFAELLLSTYYTNNTGRTINDPNENYLDKYFLEYFKSFQFNLENVNIVKNKIYCVVKTEKNKAWIEQWDIKENGDVKYNKVFQVGYVPLKKPNEDNNEELTVFAHSYYPI